MFRLFRFECFDHYWVIIIIYSDVFNANSSFLLNSIRNDFHCDNELNIGKFHQLWNILLSMFIIFIRPTF